MYHYVARTRQGLLFHSPNQARRLWLTLARAAPGLAAMCLMPNHIHLQHPRELPGLAQAMSGYSRWLNARQGHRGPLLAPLPPPTWAEGPKKVRRDARYIHLNPCRARLVADPLAWPWSTYRDAAGVSLSPLIPRAQDVERLHSYVSADPSVCTEGTLLPTDRGSYTRWDLQAAVSELLRVPLLQLNTRGQARTLWLQCMRATSDTPTAALARDLRVSRATLYRIGLPKPQVLQQVLRVAGDPRFPGI